MDTGFNIMGASQLGARLVAFAKKMSDGNVSEDAVGGITIRPTAMHKIGDLVEDLVVDNGRKQVNIQVEDLGAVAEALQTDDLPGAIAAQQKLVSDARCPRTSEERADEVRLFDVLQGLKSLLTFPIKEAKSANPDTTSRT